MRIFVECLSIVTFLVVSLAHFPGDHKPKEARWCCVTEKEMRKCQDMARAARSITSFSIPMNITCVRGQNVTHCMSRISKNEADLVTLHEADIYTAGRDFDLLPVVGEDYGHTIHTSYFVVALILKDADPSLTIKTLRGAITCHPRAGDTAGWIVPMGFLIDEKMLSWKSCNTYLSAGAYFEKSCVPGVFSSKYDPQHENPRNLCWACNKPSCPDKTERYYGYNGSYTCLVEKKGQVAFVRHSTVFEFTGINNDLNPGMDFRLLCPDGSRKEVGDYETCSLARIPAGAVMTRDNGKEYFRTRGYRIFLLELDEHLRNKTQSFEMFNSTPYGDADVLFKDSTLKLVDVSHRNTTDKWLGTRYKKILDTLESCGKDVQLAAQSNGPISKPHFWRRVILGLFMSLFLFKR
ncbi:melanotransferrin-like [Actinia tenebrosa]|uniref:Melanotransferrin-like n=1 Tax=Actinia tenebrosa TaxID=6105 RepID=A0A6P8HMD3_ACTTE|nr:melanotransferrin-like [Actinia tenebrosa]